MCSKAEMVAVEVEVEKKWSNHNITDAQERGNSQRGRKGKRSERSTRSQNKDDQFGGDDSP